VLSVALIAETFSLICESLYTERKKQKVREHRRE
jgi:hypothetical protein